MKYDKIMYKNKNADIQSNAHHESLLPSSG